MREYLSKKLFLVGMIVIAFGIVFPITLLCIIGLKTFSQNVLEYVSVL